jgi:poxvirus D5 protein-like|nr:MAG TPA: dsDNA helicase [Caudoviricetes sp.]
METKYIELQAGTKIPAHNLDTYTKDIDKIDDGALLIPENIVVVDFDHTREDLLRDVLDKYTTRAIKTERGGHLYYSVPQNMRLYNKTNVRTYNGLVVDYKTGFGGKKAMAVVKQNGVMREIINAIELDNLPELPVDLYPIYGKNTSLEDLDDGDGRNSEIFSHIKILKDKKVDDTDIGRLVNFINTKVFKTPLPLDELKATIGSAMTGGGDSEEIDIFTIDKKGNQKLDEKKVARWAIKELDLHYYSGYIHYINEEHSRFLKSDLSNKTLMAEIQKRLIKKGIDLMIKQAQETEIINQIKYAMIMSGKMVLQEDYYAHKVYPVQFRNGWSLNNNSQMLKTGAVFTPFNMNVDYDPTANDENVINFINWLCMGDKDLIGLFEEILGHILMTDEFPHHVFFFTGNDGNNGKSTMLDMIINWTGELHSAVALEQFDKGDNIALLIDKLVNCGDDIKAQMIEDSRAMKTITAGNRILCRPLYVNPFEFKPTATLLFTCNETPAFKDKSGGVARRVVVFPLENVVKVRDLELRQKLSSDSAKSTLLNLALKGLARIIANHGELTKVDAVTQATERYLMESDNIAMFFDETDVKALADDLERNTFTKLYVIYCDYCKCSGYYAVSKKKFSNRLAEFGFETYKSTGNVVKFRELTKNG